VFLNWRSVTAARAMRPAGCLDPQRSCTRVMLLLAIGMNANLSLPTCRASVIARTLMYVDLP
jgi:hypothetical protein